MRRSFSVLSLAHTLLRAVASYQTLGGFEREPEKGASVCLVAVFHCNFTWIMWCVFVQFLLFFYLLPFSLSSMHKAFRGGCFLFWKFRLARVLLVLLLMLRFRESCWVSGFFLCSFFCYDTCRSNLEWLLPGKYCCCWDECKSILGAFWR